MLKGNKTLEQTMRKVIRKRTMLLGNKAVRQQKLRSSTWNKTAARSLSTAPQGDSHEPQKDLVQKGQGHQRLSYLSHWWFQKGPQLQHWAKMKAALFREVSENIHTCCFDCSSCEYWHVSPLSVGLACAPNIYTPYPKGVKSFERSLQVPTNSTVLVQIAHKLKC